MRRSTLGIAVIIAAFAACTSGEVEVFDLPDTAARPDSGTTPGQPDTGSPAPDSSTSSDDDSGAMDSPDMGGIDELPALRDDRLDQVAWRDGVMASIDSTSLGGYFAEAGYSLPAGSAVYGARILDGAAHPAYQVFEAGDGAFDMSFWPASTIKLLSALAALEWVYSHGFTGAARIDWDSGFGDNFRDIYTRAIQVSSNIDYDRTLRAAGWDFMNATFLTPERGFPRTVITASYARVEVRNPGGYTLTEGGNTKYIAGRAGTGEYGRNDTDLFELTEGLRRIMLDGEVPESERFAIAPADVDGVKAALCSATPSYFASGASTALGGIASICHKPGWVPDNECLDHALVTTEDGRRFLLAASIPYQTNCPGLSTVAQHTLGFLARPSARAPLQPDGGELTMQFDADRTWIDAPGAVEVVIWVDGEELARSSSSDRGRFELDAIGTDGRHIVVVAYDAAGVALASRSGAR